MRMILGLALVTLAACQASAQAPPGVPGKAFARFKLTFES